METAVTNIQKKQSSVFGLLKPYLWPIIGLALLAVGSSGLGLITPKIISHSIDAFIHQTFVMKTLILEFGAVALGIFIFTYLQRIVQTYTSERVARDLRNSIAAKIASQSYEFVEKVTPARLLTNLTSDIDSIKMLIGQAIASLISSASDNYFLFIYSLI